MDLYKAIQDLYAEKEKLERVIASLEELQRTAGDLPELPKATKRRGRKSMNTEEQARTMAERCGFEMRYNHGAGTQYYWLWFFKK